MNDKAFYKNLFKKAVLEDGLIYHTAKTPPANRTVTVQNTSFTFPTGKWVQFSNEDTIDLDSNATVTILNAKRTTQSDVNQNSVFIRLDLGAHSVLLTGDIGSGGRQLPSSAIGAVEANLVTNHSSSIDVDILQVAHHGSLTSSREAFIDAVSPTYALISSGPKKYPPVILPDDEVVDMLLTKGIVVLRTDLHDKNCPVDDRVGRNWSARPGGCTNYVMEW